MRPTPIVLVALAAFLLPAPAVAAHDSADRAASASGARAAETRGERIQQARRIALRQIGDRYKYGAEGPRRFDCSGLVYFATHRAGFGGMPRSSADQADHVRRIKKRNLRPGDFLFFHDDGAVYHVAIFLKRRDGEVRMVHAPGSGERVRRDSPWTERWFAGTLRRR